MLALPRWWKCLDNSCALGCIDRASVGNLPRCPVEAFGMQHSRDIDLIDVTGENPVEQSKGLSMEVFQ